MTIRWCCYCQEFLGETAPFENFDISHGVCGACVQRGTELSELEFDRAKMLAGIQRELLDAGKREASDEEVVRLIRLATDAGVKPIDILMGFVTQLLRHIGKQWELGKVTIAEENRYTLFCERILGHVEAIVSRIPRPIQSSKLKVILLNTVGNQHTLGTRISALWLNSRGVAAKAIYPSLPTSEVLNVLREHQPQFVGISISLADQITEVIAIVAALREANLSSPPEILLGGFAVKQGLVPPIEGATQIQDLGKIVDILAGSASKKCAA